MSGFVRVLAAIVLLVAASAPLAINSAFARGAAPSVMSSPGYQRALEESRKRYRQEVQPSTRRGSSADQTASRTSALIVQVICAAAGTAPTPIPTPPPKRMQLSEPGIRTKPGPNSAQAAGFGRDTGLSGCVWVSAWERGFGFLDSGC